MILDYLENYICYQPLVPYLEDIYKFIKDAKQLPAGRYDRTWGHVLVQEDVTHFLEQSAFEVHKHCLDVQYLVSGEKMLEWADKDSLKVSMLYSPQCDIEMRDGTGTLLTIKAGMFYILFPGEAHKPCGHIQKQMVYRKIVAKIAIK